MQFALFGVSWLILVGVANKLSWRGLDAANGSKREGLAGAKMDWFLWPLILLGHVGFWCFFFNRTHATAWPRPWRKGIEKFVLAVVFLPLSLGLVWVWSEGWPGPLRFSEGRLPLVGYLSFCGAIGVWFVAAWLLRKLNRRQPHEVRFLAREVFDVERETKQRLTAGRFAEFFRLVPGNRCTWMAADTGELRLARSDAGRWDGLKIAHLSDFHLTGGIRAEYYDWLVERINAEQCDLILLSGDLVDESHCLDWVPKIFGRLQARLGKYHVLGNHDLQITDQATYRKLLESAGCQYLSGRWLAIDFRGAPVFLTGNDLPWYSQAEQLREAPPADALKLLVSHSPDQIRWAIDRQIDVMFAGHTHGGQICFPLIGPVISPSKYGVRFAGGEFKLGSTLLLVSRGISGDEPIRWHCLPQVNVWTFRA